MTDFISYLEKFLNQNLFSRYIILTCREAIGQPTPESESLAWETLLPLVGKLRSFHKFSEKMDVVVPNILRVICSVQCNEENANKR